jgi:arabinofuranosyltransferase
MNRPRVLLLPLLAAAAAFMAYMAVYQVDDVFIVYRYARNLAAGHGFVFNVGERVEGVTCFLWTVLLAAVSALGLPLPAAAPVLSAACGLATLALLARAHAEVEGRSELAPRDLLAPALLATSPGFAYWSVGALETVPFALLLTLALREHARFLVAAESPYPRRSAWWLGAASLMRPETPLIVAALALERLIAAREPAAQRALVLARWLLPIAACFAPFLLFRRAYFGDWLPNTYYAKTGVPLPALVADGLAYTGRFAGSLAPTFGSFEGRDWLPWLGWLLLLFVLAYGLARRALRAYACGALALGVAIALEGGDWMVLHRFWVPALPALALIAGHGLLRLAGKRHGRVLSAAIALALMTQGVAVALRERNGGRGLAVNGVGYQRAHVVIAKYLRDHGQPGDAVALMDVGLIGWYAPQLNVIDITGLTDRAIARAPGGFLNKRFKVGALFARNPRFLVLVPRYPADERIVAHRDFNARYRLRLRLNHRANWQPPSEYWLHLLERR